MMEKLLFRVNEFEGPLDLILHLLSKNQMSIYEIEISSLLSQYMDAIRDMQEHKLDIASEFLEMASRLVYIKTVSLLPRHETEAEQAKGELVGQLLEYQSCKQAAALLAVRFEGWKTFVRPPEEIRMDKTYRTVHPPRQLAAAYLDAVGKARRKLPPRPAVFTPLVAAPMVSVSSRVIHILRGIYHTGKMKLDDLFSASRSRSEMVASFLAVLELVKGGRLRLEEEDTQIVFVGKNRRKLKHTD